MIQPESFLYLDVSACLPDAFWTDDAQRQFAKAVTPEGRSQLEEVVMGSPSESLSQHGVLQVCLNGIEPFSTDSGDTIHILERGDKKKARDCPERAMLIEDLADALLDHERLCCRIDEILHTRRAHLIPALDLIDEEVQTLDSKTKRAEWEGLKKAVLKKLQRENFVPSGQKMIEGQKNIRNRLVSRMGKAFERYGPSMKQAQTDRAIASILTQMLSERGAALVNINNVKSLDAHAVQF